MYSYNESELIVVSSVSESVNPSFTPNSSGTRLDGMKIGDAVGDFLTDDVAYAESS